jgi:hypothetical protein
MKPMHPPLCSWSNGLGVLIVGIVTVLLLFITPSFVHAHSNGQSPQGALSTQHTDLATDHQNLRMDQKEIYQKLDTLLETMKTMTTTTPAPLCGAGTDGQRYVLAEDWPSVGTKPEYPPVQPGKRQGSLCKLRRRLPIARDHRIGDSHRL